MTREVQKPHRLYKPGTALKHKSEPMAIRWIASLPAEVWGPLEDDEVFCRGIAHSNHGFEVLEHVFHEEELAPWEGP